MEITVRFANENDLNELYMLNEEFNGVSTASQQTTKCLSDSSELIVIAYIDGGAAGFACAQSYTSFCYNEPQGEITEMYVREVYRRKGIATSMIACLEKGLHARGVRSIKILTGKENERAIKTYENAGYLIKSEAVLQKRL